MENTRFFSIEWKWDRRNQTRIQTEIVLVHLLLYSYLCHDLLIPKQQFLSGALVGFDLAVFHDDDSVAAGGDGIVVSHKNERIALLAGEGE